MRHRIWFTYDVLTCLVSCACADDHRDEIRYVAAVSACLAEVAA